MRKRDEPVRLTRIYTRGGDKGETSLGDGSRVSKLDPRVAAMGDVDELNSLVGWAGGLDRVQNELFDLGADLSVPFAAGDGRLRITDEAVGRLEQEIDEANASLPELKSFVLPGGSERAARLFLARAVCRRAERAVLAALALALAFVPLIVIEGAGNLRAATLWFWTFGAAVLLAGLGADAAHEVAHPGRGRVRGGGGCAQGEEWDTPPHRRGSGRNTLFA